MNTRIKQINTNGSFICLSVLTENLFMDNIKDCAYLLTEEGRDLLAQIHINAIDEFLGYNDSPDR